MSEGPIKQWRDGHKVPPVSTNAKKSVHAVVDRVTVCRSHSVLATTILEQVTCSMCLAGIRADEAGMAGE